MVAIDMASEDASVGTLKEFDEAVGLSRGHGFAVGAVIAFTAHIVGALRLAVVLAHAHAGRLRRGEDGCRHETVGGGALLLHDVVHHMQSLSGGGVCEHLPAVDVADGIYALDVGLEVLVGDDGAFGCFDARLFETESVGAGCPSGGHEHLVGLHLRRLSLALIHHSVGGDFLHRRLHDEVDTPSGDGLAEALGDVAVEHGQAFLEIFHHGDLGAQTAEDGGELHAYDSCAYDAHPWRDGIGVEELIGRDHDTAVGSGDGQHLCL